ncbi:hypothetical protein [Muricauda sp. MAR_2010_75]|uniref:hypothetical protein n=1 Tax=Allomuricauda sp. MAR_2010_75 TaxID=1250232 RepID=UPI000562ED1F|nr:hypothetical protein [Muricauda sp. MAR_2010_75]
MDKKKLVISVSGGRTSAFMARYIQTSSKYNDFEKLFVFANTGLERPETIQFLKDMVTYWGLPLYSIEGEYSTIMGVGVKHRIVDFKSLDMDGVVFKNSIVHVNKGKFNGLPSSANPYCSDRLKVRPIKHFAKSFFGSNDFINAVGYRFEDMPKRITISSLELNKKIIAPLLTDFNFPISNYHLDSFWRKEPFSLKIPSSLGNCRLCFKKSDLNLIRTIRNEESKYLDFYYRLEKEYHDTFFRGKKSIIDLINDSKIENLKFSDLGESCFCGN